METVWADTRYAARLLLKQRAFSVIAIATLAIGIGASTALFSVIDAALLHPLPYPHPEQLVSVSLDETLTGGRPVTYAPALTDVREWRTAASTVAAACVWRHDSPIMVDTGQFERVSVIQMSEGCLETYGAAPTIGRGIERGDVGVGAPAVVVLGYGYWKSRFAGSPDVLGRRLQLADGAATIVGVLPRQIERGSDIVRPLQLGAGDAERRGRGTTIYARLRPGISRTQAAQQLSSLASAAQSSATKARLASLYDVVTQGYGTTMRMLAGAVTLLLLLACVNVAGLLLARGAGRHQELAVRASLGASRIRLVRQLLTESLLLAAAGAALGVFVAWMSLDALVSIIPLSLPDDAPASLNLEVMALAAIASIVSAFAFGLVPALRLSRSGGQQALARAARRNGPALSRRQGQMLIGAEVAIAMVLLAGAGVLVRSFARLVSADVGFDPDRVVALDAVPATPTPAALGVYYPELVRRIRAMPAVEAVGAVDNLPLVGSASMGFATVAGQPRTMVETSAVVPGYFEALGIRLIAGRVPHEADMTSGRRLVMMSEDAARLLFGTAPAVGQHLTLGTQDCEVLGVVSNVRHWGALWARESKIYRLFGQNQPGVMSIVVRMRPGAPIPFDQLRSAAQAVGPRVFVEGIRPGDDWLSTNTVTPRHRTLLFGVLGGLGVLLALVGIFSMTAYAVANRTQEIGVRMALGARVAQVVGTILSDAVLPIWLGTLIGIAGGLAATKIIAKFLYQTTSNDPLTFTLAACGLVLVACLSAWIPARHAARVDPMIALRAE